MSIGVLSLNMFSVVLGDAGSPSAMLTIGARVLRSFICSFVFLLLSVVEFLLCVINIRFLLKSVIHFLSSRGGVP